MAIELEDGTIIRSLPEEVSHLGEQQEETQIQLDNLQARVEADLAGVLHYKGSVDTYSDLPDEADVGDVYNVNDTGQNYAWTGSEWDELGSIVDVSRLVDLASPQTITGIKTFQPGLQVGRPSQNRLVFLTLNGLTLLPAVTSFDIGDNTNRVRAIYTTDINIAGGINKNSSGYKLTLPNTSTLTADSELLDTASAQTITGLKTFAENIVLSGDSVSSKYIVLGSSPSNFIGLVGSSPFISSNSGAFLTNATFSSSINGVRDLGRSLFRWKDGYFSGQVYAQNTFNVINASDIVSNTLTQEQYDLITNGKPTLIKGTFLGGYANYILMPPLEGSTDWKFTAFYTTAYPALVIGVVQLIKATKVISLNTGKYFRGDQFDSLSTSKFNNKTVPAYPSSTGSFTLKCVDGVLTWVQD